MAKIRKLIAPCVKQTAAPGAENEPPNKIRKLSSEIVEVDMLMISDTSSNTWLSLKGIDLTVVGSDLEKSSVTTMSISHKKY